MDTFKTARAYTFSDILRESSVMLFFIALIYIIVLSSRPDKLTLFSLILPFLLLLKEFFDASTKKRVMQITFDTNKDEILILLKSLFSDRKQIRLPFADAKMEVVEEKSKLKIFESLKLYILKGKMEVLELSKSKDRLSVETLQNIVKAAERHSIQIIR
jgi:hypothetical protein